MPRPGPRPYECVRRAWHSDRHPPIRGSLIQEIFRIANEVHSSTTRKNREWLEKLPTVVIKAEEIMYSKANSEAEYSDRKTLWDRLNDAIDTIIRRDQSTETGQLLQPCIEAALHLGCTPRRSSRSQRNESPRCYLKSQNAGPSSVPPSNSPSEVSGNRTNNTPTTLHSPRNLMLNQNTQSRKQNELISPGLSKNFVPDINQPASAQTLSNSWPVYPLYYNSQIQPADVKLTNPSNSCSHLLDGSFGAPDFVSQSLQVSSDERQLPECDLTLRLGCVVVPRSSAENARPLEDENFDARNFMEERNSRDHCTTNQITSFPFRFQ